MEQNGADSLGISEVLKSIRALVRISSAQAPRKASRFAEYRLQ